MKKAKTFRPKPVYLWTVADVQKFIRRHCGEFLETINLNQYLQLFSKVTILYTFAIWTNSIYSVLISFYLA